MKFIHGISFLLDLAGHHFGFTTVLYTKRQYEQQMLHTHHTPLVEDIEALIMENTEDAMSSERTHKQMQAWELLDLAFYRLVREDSGGGVGGDGDDSFVGVGGVGGVGLGDST
jgi:hypothetical protein